MKQPKYSDSFVIRSDKGLALETSALKLSTVASLRYLLLDNAKLPCYRRSTTVSLETYPLYSFTFQTPLYRFEGSSSAISMNTYIRERRQECMAGTAVCRKIFDLKESSGDWVQMVLKLKFATSKRVQALGVSHR